MARRPRRSPPRTVSLQTPVPIDQRAASGGSLLPGQPPPPPITPEQHAERRAFIESLLLAGMPNSRVVAICAQPFGRTAGGQLTGLGVGPNVVVPICVEIRKQWADDYKAREGTKRTDQITQLQNDLARMRSQAAVPWSAVQQTEKLRAEIEANLAPRRLEVAVHAIPDALAASVAGMTDADVELMIADELEREKKLRSIETTAEALPSP